MSNKDLTTSRNKLAIKLRGETVEEFSLFLKYLEFRSIEQVAIVACSTSGNYNNFASLKKQIQNLSNKNFWDLRSQGFDLLVLKNVKKSNSNKELLAEGLELLAHEILDLTNEAITKVDLINVSIKDIVSLVRIAVDINNSITPKGYNHAQVKELDLLNLISTKSSIGD